MAFANGDGETRFLFLFLTFLFFFSLAEEARRCVDVHVHRVYIEDTYVRSISMYEVSVLLLYYNKQYLPRAVSSSKYVGRICMTTIKDTRTLFLRREMRELHAYVYVCMYPQPQQQQQQPTASSTCDMESTSSCTVDVVAELLCPMVCTMHAVENCLSKLQNAEFCR